MAGNIVYFSDNTNESHPLLSSYVKNAGNHFFPLQNLLVNILLKLELKWKLNLKLPPFLLKLEPKLVLCEKSFGKPNMKYSK